MRLAGIDIGTLTCRLLIAETTAEGLSEVHADRRILRLGEAVDQDRRLGRAAMNRVIATLQEWRVILGPLSGRSACHGCHERGARR